VSADGATAISRVAQFNGMSGVRPPAHTVVSSLNTYVSKYCRLPKQEIGVLIPARRGHKPCWVGGHQPSQSVPEQQFYIPLLIAFISDRAAPEASLRFRFRGRPSYSGNFQEVLRSGSAQVAHPLGFKRKRRLHHVRVGDFQWPDLLPHSCHGMTGWCLSYQPLFAQPMFYGSKPAAWELGQFIIHGRLRT
jgi:hypothetical protein